MSTLEIILSLFVPISGLLGGLIGVWKTNKSQEKVLKIKIKTENQKSWLNDFTNIVSEFLVKMDMIRVIKNEYLKESNKILRDDKKISDYNDKFIIIGEEALLLLYKLHFLLFKDNSEHLQLLQDISDFRNLVHDLQLYDQRLNDLFNLNEKIVSKSQAIISTNRKELIF